MTTRLVLNELDLDLSAFSSTFPHRRRRHRRLPWMFLVAWCLEQSTPLPARSSPGRRLVETSGIGDVGHDMYFLFDSTRV